MSRHFGNSLHVAFVVPNVDREIDRLLGIGIGPIFVMRRIRVAARYRNNRHDPLMTAAFAYSGNMLLEFLEPHDTTPSGMREFLERTPGGGTHHFAYFSDNFQATLLELEREGQKFEVVQEYIHEDGTPYEIYIQPESDPQGFLVQLVHRGPLEHFYEEMRSIAQHWDGTMPIRRAADLLPPEMRPVEAA
jgi:hypothetical protein